MPPPLPSLSSLTQANEPTHTVSVALFVDDQDVTHTPGGLGSISIYKEFNKIPTAKITISDGRVEDGTFDKSNSPNFIPGKMADIRLGYQNETATIFKGVIVKHSIKALSNRASVLELDCKDPSVKMALVRRSRYFSDMKDKDVFQQILDGYAGKGITAGTLADTDFTHPELVQYHCTDWDFLVLRAEANGLVVVADNGTINIIKPEVAATADHAVLWGENIIDIEAEIDARTHYPDVETATWDSTTQEPVKENGDGSSGGGGGLLGGLAAVASAVGSLLGVGDGAHDFPDALYGSEKQLLYHGGDMATQELSAWAKGQKNRAQLSHVRGRVCVRGQDFKPSKTLDLQQVSDRFDGKHLISGVMHQVYDGTWRSDIQFGMTAKTFAETAEDIALPEAAGLMAAIRGLHIGVVTKIGGDDQSGKHRIKVRIPYIATQNGRNEDGIWARLATLHAGNNRGFVFRPEIDDEVILGFINDDPNDAVILGSLHSNTNVAPIAASDENPQKVFFAKQGMQMIFDDQKKSIEFKTQEGYSILLSEQDGKVAIKDKNNNTIELSQSGISMKSSTNIKIEATGSVEIKGTPIKLN